MIASSGNGVQYFVRYDGPYATLIAGKSPWGIYRADDYNPVLNILPEARQNGLNAVTSGAISSLFGLGNGATQKVTYIQGGTSSAITWPKYAFVDFTICTCTRYIDGSGNILIGDATRAWFHGHYRGKRGVAFYQNDVTNIYYSTGTTTDWLVMCGKNPSSPSAFLNSIRADSSYVGYYGPGQPPYQLSMNNFLASSFGPDGANLGHSNWAFKDLVIWDQLLTGKFALCYVITCSFSPITTLIVYTLS
jgi:hypothetical protein